MRKAQPRPFYGVHGNLLVEDLEFSREAIEAILDDRFKPSFIMQCMLPCAVFRRYPQLSGEHDKRRAYPWPSSASRRGPSPFTTA